MRSRMRFLGRPGAGSGRFTTIQVLFRLNLVGLYKIYSAWFDQPETLRPLRLENPCENHDISDIPPNSDEWHWTAFALHCYRIVHIIVQCASYWLGTMRPNVFLQIRRYWRIQWVPRRTACWGRPGRFSYSFAIVMMLVEFTIFTHIKEHSCP